MGHLLSKPMRKVSPGPSLSTLPRGRRPDHPLELGQPLLERRLGLDPDLELAVREHTHPAGVHGPERDDDGLARDTEPIEDLEDALDLLERDGRERHAPHPSAAAGSAAAGAGPRPTRSHARLASQTINATRLMKRPHTTASSRRLKICTCTSASFAAGTLPAATPAASFSAWARKPIAGSGDKIFW